MVDVIASHDNVDSRMELDTCNFSPAKLHHVVDVVDVVILDDGEYGTHTADYAALLAVMDVVAAYDVASDVLLEPAVVLASADRITLHLRRALEMLVGKVMVVLGIKIFAETDAGALGKVNFIVLNDPSL